MASPNWVPTNNSLTIQTQPVSQSVGAGYNLNFTARALGLPLSLQLSYQWLFNGTNLSEITRISGSTANTLTITNASFADAGFYKLVVTSGSLSVTSAVAVLTVVPPNLVQEGNFESPNVVPNLHYTNFNVGANIAGVWLVESSDSQFLIQGNFDGSSFYATPTGSQFAWLNNGLGETVLRQDLATPLKAGTNYGLSFLQSTTINAELGLVTVSIMPAASNNPVFTSSFSLPQHVNWTQQQTNFSVPADGLYTLRIKSTQGYYGLVDSLCISHEPTILAQPVSQAVVIGGNAALTVFAGGLAPLAYQWFCNGTNLVNNSRISGSSANNLTITNVAQGDLGNYQVVITSPSGSITSAVASLSFVVVTDPHPGNFIQDGSFEFPFYVAALTVGQTFGGVWLVESSDSSALVAINQNQNQGNFPTFGIVVFYRPTPAGIQLLGLNGVTVFRQDVATSLTADTNYNLTFLQSGAIDFHAPAQVILSIGPTGFTNEVWSQIFTVASNADWTLQQAAFSVPSNGLYSLRIKSIAGSVAYVDDFALLPAPASVVTVTPPVFQNISRVGNALQFSWSAGAGQIYQLQYKTNLNQPDWINLGSPITATNTSVSTSDALGNDLQRFYRVRAQ